MPNGTYGGVRGKETKVGQKTFVSRPTRFAIDECILLERPGIVRTMSTRKNKEHRQNTTAIAFLLVQDALGVLSVPYKASVAIEIPYVCGHKRCSQQLHL